MICCAWRRCRRRQECRQNLAIAENTNPLNLKVARGESGPTATVEKRGDVGDSVYADVCR